MNKLAILFLLLIGCGAPQTSEEEFADEMLHDFLISCEEVYGKCEFHMSIAALVETKEQQSCWIEKNSPLRSLGLYKEDVKKNNKKEIYKAMFECGLNLGNQESKLLDFNYFAELVDLNQSE